MGNNEVIKIAHGLQENSWTISLTIHMIMVSLTETEITLDISRHDGGPNFMAWTIFLHFQNAGR